jgi:hypothetical protein
MDAHSVCEAFGRSGLANEEGLWESMRWRLAAFTLSLESKFVRPHQKNGHREEGVFRAGIGKSLVRIWWMEEHCGKPPNSIVDI